MARNAANADWSAEAQRAARAFYATPANALARLLQRAADMDGESEDAPLGQWEAMLTGALN